MTVAVHLVMDLIRYGTEAHLIIPVLCVYELTFVGLYLQTFWQHGMLSLCETNLK